MIKFVLERLVDGEVSSVWEDCPIRCGHKSIRHMKLRIQRMNRSRGLEPYKNGFEWPLYEGARMRWWFFTQETHDATM
jgi:hypothetical protein